MTVARDYGQVDPVDHLHHLIDRLPTHQARRLLRLVRHDPELAAYDEDEPTAADKPDEEDEEVGQRLSFVGSVAGGPTDLAERAEDYLAEYFNHSS